MAAGTIKAGTADTLESALSAGWRSWPGSPATMKILVGVIASISLVVGGIGIRNHARLGHRAHREIGIRMAVGAAQAMCSPSSVLKRW